LLLTAQKQTDPLSGRMLAEFSNVLLEPYGIADAELFLESATSKVITVRLDPEEEKLVVIAGVGDSDLIDFSLPPSKMRGEEMWQSKDATLAFARQMGFVLIGDPGNVKIITDAAYSRGSESYLDKFKWSSSPGPIKTVSNETTIAAVVADVLSERRSDTANAVSSYFTETRFTKSGMERKTTSDFGLIGSIIAELSSE
jgi:hypothetical protein